MVVGAGRGPLVRSTINASVNVKRKVKIYVVEKNPNAIVTLTALQEEMWPNQGRARTYLVITSLTHQRSLIHHHPSDIHLEIISLKISD